MHIISQAFQNLGGCYTPDFDDFQISTDLYLFLMLNKRLNVGNKKGSCFG
jgi:hypothetical protein